MVFPPLPLITLLTDFGTSDVFVASMQGVILGINPQARMVDLTHDVPAHDIRTGAYLLHAAARYFPAGTIHVAVVDPGVGGSRRPLLVSTATQHFLAPDNGLLSYVLAEEPAPQVRELTAQQYFLKSLGPTFHGRDLFAPAAAWLSRGEPIDAFGPRITHAVRFEVRTPVRANDTLIGEVQHIDRFGNLMTNVSGEELRELADLETWRDLTVRIGDTRLNGLQRCYADAPAGTLAALVNSDGRLELFCNQGRADELTKAKMGERVEVQLHGENQQA